MAFFLLPAILDDFRLNLFGRYCALAITALAIDLIIRACNKEFSSLLGAMGSPCT